MPRGTSQSGRTRVVVTVVLAVLIGAVGAFLLPVLIHEARSPAADTFSAEVGFEIPVDGLRRGADLRVLARLPGGPWLATTEPVPANASATAVVGLLADGIEDADWPEAARPRVVGRLLDFTGLTAVAGDPGGSGAPLSLAVSGRPGQALALRISRGIAPGTGGRVRLAFSARGVVGSGETAAVPEAATVTAPWTEARDVLGVLAKALAGAGWQTTTEAGGQLSVRALPNEAEIGSAILTVEVDGAPDPPCAWSIELLR
jgi:hypothetical protein